eukprot:3005592-Rhodomonas_salina.1
MFGVLRQCDTLRVRLARTPGRFTEEITEVCETVANACRVCADTHPQAPLTGSFDRGFSAGLGASPGALQCGNSCKVSS